MKDWEAEKENTFGSKDTLCNLLINLPLVLKTNYCFRDS